MPVVAPKFAWKCEPQAEAIVKQWLEQAVNRNLFLQGLQTQLQQITSTRLFDWIDHIEIGNSLKAQQELEKAGFTIEVTTANYVLLKHPGAQLPKVALRVTDDDSIGIFIQVDCIADFLMTHGLSLVIEGSPFSGYRRALVSRESGSYVYVIERRGCLLLEPEQLPPETVPALIRSYEKWKTRPRMVETEEEEIACIESGIKIAHELVCDHGSGMAAHIVLDVERNYWQAKNRAGQVQKSRQDRLGLGWANHDHHTFRCIRSHFHRIIHLFEVLGFTCRERFYAGKDAGWGAQVMEHTLARFVLFLDVDLSEDEVAIDFAHEVLEPHAKLGTIGLWCALHGESLAKAGMHHLEAQFDFSLLESALTKEGIAMMAPFSICPYLKQAFSMGEMWLVPHQRVQRLVREKRITEEQAAHFIKDGALGSHLENLQRDQGYKGFNQKNVSSIIKETDPRRTIGMA